MRELLFVALAGCGFSTSVRPPDDGQPVDAPMIDAPKPDGAPGAARKRSITIPDTKIFANLTDFPVWLVIDDPAGLGAKALASGDDIYFTRTDGTPLEHERVAWDKATGHLEAWVEVALTDGQANVFDLRFGDPGPAHLPNPLQTWSNGFLAVWHMDDALASSTMVRDARGVVNGTAVNGPVSATGKLGKALDFDGSNDEVTFTNPISGSMSSTISAWIAVTQPDDGFSSVMCVGNPAMNQSRFLHTNFGGLCRGFYGNDVQLSVDVHDTTFTLLHWVYDDDANTSTLYRDGAVIGTVANVGGTINTTGTGGRIGNAPMQWGPGGNTTNPIEGLVDEVRIANTPRTAGWVQTEYENQRDVATFFTLGPEMPAQ